MAKKKAKDEPAEESSSLAVNDAWTGMLVVSFLALSAGTGFLVWDYIQYSDQPPPTATKYNMSLPGIPAKKELPPNPAPKEEAKDPVPPPAKDVPAKDQAPPAKDVPAKDAPGKDAPAKDAPAKDALEKKDARLPGPFDAAGPLALAPNFPLRRCVSYIDGEQRV